VPKRRGAGCSGSGHFSANDVGAVPVHGRNLIAGPGRAQHPPWGVVQPGDLSGRFPGPSGEPLMLCLTRTEGQTLRISDDIVIHIVGVGSNQIRIGIKAPAHVKVLREELRGKPKPDKSLPKKS
jgi:carbon storage regulator CsrA